MTRTEDALLAAVVAEPEADLPRLAYADFREERGDDARAEFVRVQVRLADPRMRPCACLPRYTCERCVLRRRERELLHDAVHWWAWLADLYAITGRSTVGDLGHCSDGPDTFAVRFRRGFVAEISLPCADWLAHGPALVRAAPLGRVTLSDREPWRSAWSASGQDGRWWVCASRPDDGLPEVLPRPLFRALTRLRRWGQRTTDGLRFSGRDAALLALSEAALAWARAAAVAAPPAAGV